MNFAKAVQKKLDRFELVNEDGSAKYWPIIMTGKTISNGLFEWTLRDELSEAMIELDYVRINHVYIDNIDTLVIKINEDIEGFKKEFAETRKELADMSRSPNSNILFKYDSDTNRDWAINEGAGTEVQLHIYLSGNTIGYGLGFNTLYVRFKDNKTPIEYIKPFMDAFIELQDSEVIQTLVNKGFKLDKTLEEFINPIEDEHYLFGRTLEIKDNELSFIGYYNILNDLKGDLFAAYKAVFKRSNELQLISDNINEEAKLKTNNSLVVKVDNTALMAKNTILYGPPGTGKTYKTTELAVQCVAPDWYSKFINEYLDDETKRQKLKEKYDELTTKGHIAFTTFHQSFAYEDFVEGIRPIVVDNEAGDSLISYDVAEGVFKQLCDSAVATVTKGSTQTVNIEGKKIWKLSLGNTLTDTDDLYNECLENDYVLLGWGDDIDFTGCSNRKQVVTKIEKSHNISLADDKNNYKATAVNTFKNYMSIGDLVVVSDGNHKFRAIAEITGDYEFLEDDERYGYQQKRLVNWLRVYKPSLPISRLFDKSLSQMTVYQLKDTTINREKLKQLLSIESTIEDTKDLPYLLIIDEINRGNVSRIFGELITLLEPDKRKGGSDAREVTLPYSKEKFSVPSNLYVLGTMNTADKSLAQLDLALRRRFEFIELLPNPSLLKGISVYGVEVSEILKIINARIEVLLDREHTIGHSYFWKLKELQIEAEKESELANIFKKRIIPLLQEYFFSDWERIGWVLNDPKKNSDEQFIQTKDLSPKLSELFGDDIEGLVNDRRYKINEDAFSNPQSYKKILMSHAQSSESSDSQE